MGILDFIALFTVGWNASNALTVITIITSGVVSITCAKMAIGAKKIDARNSHKQELSKRRLDAYDGFLAATIPFLHRSPFSLHGKEVAPIFLDREALYEVFYEMEGLVIKTQWMDQDSPELLAFRALYDYCSDALKKIKDDHTPEIMAAFIKEFSHDAVPLAETLRRQVQLVYRQPPVFEEPDLQSLSWWHRLALKTWRGLNTPYLCYIPAPKPLSTSASQGRIGSKDRKNHQAGAEKDPGT